MKKIVLALVAFVFIIGGVFALVREQLPKTVRHTLTISDCALEDSSELVVDEGNELTLFVTADTNALLHIHDYNLERELAAGEEERITFRATDPGRHVFELEGQCELGEIVVRHPDGSMPDADEHNDEPHEDEEHDNHEE